MDELDAIMEKYEDRPLREHFESLDDINRFAIQLYRDVAEIYDCLSRVKVFQRKILPNKKRIGGSCREKVSSTSSQNFTQSKCIDAVLG
jgi:hypothetical protein